MMTTAKQALGDLPDWPRCLSADEAARYVGVSRNVFDAEVTEGLWPKGLTRGPSHGKVTWDRRALDRRLDIIMGRGGNHAETEESGFERRAREAATRRKSRPKDPRGRVD
jgi:hypothetical protein